MFSIDSPMPPIWIMYPHITQYSIGWRMGYGEGYKYDLYDWLNTLSDEERVMYDNMFPRPIFWNDLSYLDNLTEEDDDSEEIENDNECWINNVFIQFWNKKGSMKYSIDTYKRDSIIKEKNAILFGKPNNTLIDKSCLSQEQKSPFGIDIHDYSCIEQYRISQKALLFDDQEINQIIMDSEDPTEMQKAGREIKNFDQTIWDKYKYTIVLTGNYYKFTQNQKMRNYLLSTKDAILIEADPLDTTWGIGLDESRTEAYNIDSWKGQNLLGFALMEVRDELKRIYKNYDLIDWSKLEEYTL